MPLLHTSLLISLIAVICVWVMGRKDPCGRPWLTALCLGVLLLLPLLSLLPKVQVEVFQASGGVARDSAFMGIAELMTIAWAVVTILLTIRFFLNRRHLQQWLLSAEDTDCSVLLKECAAMLGVKNLPQLRLKSGLTSPVVAGLRRPVILLPATSVEWNEETRKMAILHELGHIQRRDLWVRSAAEIACILHWYNPLVWWLRAKLLSQCEYACDALVISSGADKRSYITALCDVVESALEEVRPRGLLAMADHVPLKLRVNRLIGGVKVGKPWMAVSLAVLTTATALGLSLVRPAAVAEVITGVSTPYTQEEIDLRHSADPFPGE